MIGAGLTLIILTGNDPVALGLGAVDVNANAGIGIGFAAEVIGTAILVFTVFGAAVDGRAPAGFAGIVIGFIVYGIIILVGPITGAALNPARQIGPEILELIIGSKTNLGALLPVYIAGPIVGGLVGAFLGRRRLLALRTRGGSLSMALAVSGAAVARHRPHRGARRAGARDLGRAIRLSGGDGAGHGRPAVGREARRRVRGVAVGGVLAAGIAVMAAAPGAACCAPRR